MEKLNRTLSEQTEYLIKALENVLSAKENIYSSLTFAYGEEQGDHIFTERYEGHFNNLIDTLKMGIGESMEVNMSMTDFNLY
jgi:hypothetical protein